MRSYISCSETFDWIRSRLGIEKPKWAAMDEWDEWQEKTKAEKPIAYWFTEDFPRYLDNIYEAVTDIYYKPRYYIRNRFYRKTHILRTDCKPGEYMDHDERILTALTNAVIDYVEIELAYKSMWCGTEESKDAAWKDGRCPQFGLSWLLWETTLKNDRESGFNEDDIGYGEPTHQARAAEEIYAIYNWAKARPNRPDPHDAGGWTDICREGDEKGYKWYRSFGKEKPADDPDYDERRDAALKRTREIEQQYDQEDEDMLLRLIKIRRSLWT